MKKKFSVVGPFIHHKPIPVTTAFQQLNSIFLALLLQDGLTATNMKSVDAEKKY